MKKIFTALALTSALLITPICHAKTITTDKNILSTPPKSNPTSPPVTEEIKNLTGNLTLISNYLFRGISQSNNLPAIQGGFTYTFLKPGIYFTLWGTNANITDTTHNDAVATVEFDTIAGIKNNITDKLSYDISIARYNYPKASGLDYNEFVGLLTYKIFTLSIGYSSNVFNAHGNGVYAEAAVIIPIPSKYIFNIEDVSIAGAFGNYALPKAAGNTYNNYYVQISKSIKNYALSLQYANTNRKYYNNSLDGPHVVAAVSADF